MLEQNIQGGREWEKNPHHIKALGHSKDHGVTVSENWEPFRGSEHKVS